MAGTLAEAAAALRRGRLVVFPTDTLWGIAARASDGDAVHRLHEAKRRPSGTPISVAVSSVEELETFVDWGTGARSFARRHLPGPYTLIGAARSNAPLASGLRAGDGSLGVRVPAHPVARELARRTGPVTATSANRHGGPTPVSLSAIRRVFGDEVAVYLDGGPAPSGRPSRLIDLRGTRPAERHRGTPPGGGR